MKSMSLDLSLIVVLTFLAPLGLLGQAQHPADSASSQTNGKSDSDKSNLDAVNSERPKLVTVITVTGEPLPVSLAPASVSVVDDEELRDAHSISSADILRAVPFVDLEQNGSEGALGTLTIRGGKPNLVLMLIDGIPVNDLSNLLGGAFDFSTLLTHDVERVEIVRGPLSSSYGSEAMSGVINVITKPTHYESEVTGGIETGSFGTAGLNLEAEGAKGRLGYKVNGAFLHVGVQVKSDSFSTSTFSTSSDYVPNARSILNWTLRWIQFQDSSFPPNGGGPELSILRDPETSNSGNFLGGLNFQHQVSQLWTAHLALDIFSRGEHAFTPPILDSPTPTPHSQPSTLVSTRYTRPRIMLQNLLNLGSHWQGHFNVQGSEDIGSNNTLIENLYSSNFSTNRAVFNGNGDLVYFTNQMTMTAALGINKTAGFDVQVAPRFGVAMRVAKKTVVKASWGQSYRVPDLYALENPSVGNPDLLPEKVTGLDAGLEVRFSRNIALSGTYYHNVFTNLIDFSSTAFRLVNRSRVHTQGVETEASLSFPHGVELKAWGSSLDWTIESSTEPLRDEPDWEAGLSIDARLPRHFHASTTTLWVGRRYDFQLPAPNIDSVGGYSSSNLVLGYDSPRRIGFYARVDNAFARRFHEYLGFPNAGISCRVGVTYRLR